jgi:alpha-D-xyloside xylohydrolase
LSDGVLFEIKKQNETDAAWIKIQVCTDDNICVFAAPVKSFSERQSLMVDKTVWEPVKWSVVGKKDWDEISTSKVTVRVDSVKGGVTFFDSSGKLLLREKAGGGKIITQAYVMGEKTFHVQQLFNSPEDEAFYGLDQHQNGILNYKGHDVDLWQLNIVDIVPFLVSS